MSKANNAQAELVGRLRAEEPMGMLSGCMDSVRLINPDGPEAAAEIERMAGEVAELRALRFVNSDARPKEAVIHCDIASIPLIMAWYGAFHAGDRYAVYVDGEKVQKDRNGELVRALGGGE